MVEICNSFCQTPPTFHGWTSCRTPAPDSARVLIILDSRSTFPQHWRLLLTANGNTISVNAGMGRHRLDPEPSVVPFFFLLPLFLPKFLVCTWNLCSYPVRTFYVWLVCFVVVSRWFEVFFDFTECLGCDVDFKWFQRHVLKLAWIGQVRIVSPSESLRWVMMGPVVAVHQLLRPFLLGPTRQSLLLYHIYIYIIYISIDQLGDPKVAKQRCAISSQSRPLFAQTNFFFKTCWKPEFVPDLFRT